MTRISADPQPSGAVEPDMDIDLSDTLSEVDPTTQIKVDEDGGVTITLGPQRPTRDPGTEKFDDNLADDLDESRLGLVAEDLLMAIQSDDESRREWLDTRAEGIRLLGLKLERPDASSSDGMEGMSTVRHPLLLEAVLRFQANARSELLPTDGPVKIRDDGQTQAEDDVATALERGMNHYLTTTASEYYPDTDRMLWWVGFGGMAFKKVYIDPIRRRPVSEMADAADVIVSNDATDIRNATRITHRIKMRKATLKRMQIVGAYRDVDLVESIYGMTENAVDEAVDEIQGLSNLDIRPEDHEHTIYECYCELDLEGFEHQENGEPTGLPLPYKVTMDLDSRQILEIRRNWDEGDDLCLPRQVMVPFTFVPGMGFYGIGLVHILGNTTNAITGAWRIMLDAGMFKNFPGGLISDTATRQESSNFRMRPGEYAKVKTGGQDIRAAVMALPYEGPDPATMSLVGDIAATGQRIGGTAEINVGEGRQDAPVGTTLALIEQAGKIMDAVHKRLCAAQAVEFGLLVDKFREMPDAFWRGNKRAKITDEAVLLQALDNYDLVPVADPNTSSHMQRVNKMMALRQMAKELGPMAPLYFDLDAINKGSIEMLQIPNGLRYLNPNPPPVGSMPPQMGKGAGAGQAPPDPTDQQAKMMAAGATVADAQTRAKLADAKIQFDQASLALKAHETQQGLGTDPVAVMEARTKQMDAETRQRAIVVDERNNLRDATNQAADRDSENHIAALDAFRDLAMHAGTLGDNEAARAAEVQAAGLGS